HRPPPAPPLFPYTTLFRSRYLAARRMGNPRAPQPGRAGVRARPERFEHAANVPGIEAERLGDERPRRGKAREVIITRRRQAGPQDRKSTRLNSSHQIISYA